MSWVKGLYGTGKMSSLLHRRCNWVNLFPWVWLVAVPPPTRMIRSGFYRSFLLLVLLCLLCCILQGGLPVVGVLRDAKVVDHAVVQCDFGSIQKGQDFDGGPPLEEFLSVLFIQEHELLSLPGDGGVSRGLAERPFAEDVGQVIRGRSRQEGRFLPFGFHGEACIVLVGVCGEEGFASSMVVMPASRMSTTGRCCRVPQRRSTRPFACAEEAFSGWVFRISRAFPNCVRATVQPLSSSSTESFPDLGEKKIVCASE